MGSRKKSARMTQRRSFEQGLGDELGGVFAREDARRARRSEERR